MAKHRAFLKNVQITYYPRFSFTSKTGENSLKRIKWNQTFKINSEEVENALRKLEC